MFQKLRSHASPSMVLAIVAIVFAMSGSAFAAKQLISGRDIQNGSIGADKLSRSAKRSLTGKTGKRGPAGTDGQVGFPGPSGPQGSTGDRGPQGERGPAGPEGARGIAGPQGETGRVGPTGRTGDTGLPGVSLVSSEFGSASSATIISLLDSGPNFFGAPDLVTSQVLEAGVTYRIDAAIEATNPTAAAGPAYGVGRLFLDGSELDTVTTALIPDDAVSAVQGSVTVTTSTGGTVYLQGGIRSDTFVGGTDGQISGSLIVSRFG